MPYRKSRTGSWYNVPRAPKWILNARGKAWIGCGKCKHLFWIDLELFRTQRSLAHHTFGSCEKCGTRLDLSRPP